MLLACFKALLVWSNYF